MHFSALSNKYPRKCKSHVMCFKGYGVSGEQKLSSQAEGEKGRGGGGSKSGSPCHYTYFDTYNVIKYFFFNAEKCIVTHKSVR